jgi:hypothetical protein
VTTPKEIKPPIRPKDDFRPWKPGEFRTPSTGNAARDVFRNLPSAVKPEIDNTTKDPKREGR